MSKTQASKSDPRDALGGTDKNKQKPENAHVYKGQRTSLDPCESRDRTPKKKPEAAHVGPWNIPGEHEETLRKGAFPNRKAPGDAKEVPGGAAKARRAGPHGSQINSSSDNNAAPKKRHTARIG